MSTFSALRKGYGDFVLPVFKVLAAGEDLDKAGLGITGLSVDLGMGTTCNSCRFSVDNVYEHGSRKISSAALSKLKPGTKISIKLGYDSSLEEVFFGYVNQLSMNYSDDGAKISVTCLDARSLMREGSNWEMYKDKKMPDIVGTILDKYSPLVGSKSVNVASLEQETNIAQSGDDLSFLMDAAKTRGLYFYMEGSKAVMDKASDDTCVEFDWGQCDVDYSIKYLNTELKASGHDLINMKDFQYTSDAKQKAVQEDLVKVTHDIRLNAHLLGDAGEKIIKALAETAVRESKGGSIRCQGLPDLKLGKKVKINDFPLSSQKTGDTFTIISVKHSIGDNGFESNVEFEG